MLLKPVIMGMIAVIGAVPVFAQHTTGSALKSPQDPPLQWLLQLNGYPANTMLTDPRFKRDLQVLLPHTHVPWDRHPLSELAPALMQVDQSPIRVQDDRFVTVSGSSPGLWTSRSMLWFDVNHTRPLGIFTYAQNLPAASNRTGTAVQLDAYTTLSAQDAIPGAFIAQIAEYVRSLGSNVKVVSNIHFSDGTKQPLHFR
jgi:hypothetical protein